MRLMLPAALALAVLSVQPACAAAGDPAWSWPSSTQNPAVQKSISEGGYTAEELRNIRNTLDMLSVQGPKREAFGAPGARTTRHGFDGLSELYGSNGFSATGIPDRQDHVEAIIAKADRVWVIWTIDGHHAGNLFGFPATGKPMHLREAALMVYGKDGKRTDATFYADDMALYIQAGGKVQFPPGPAAAK